MVRSHSLIKEPALYRSWNYCIIMASCLRKHCELIHMEGFRTTPQMIALLCLWSNWFTISTGSVRHSKSSVKPAGFQLMALTEVVFYHCGAVVLISRSSVSCSGQFYSPLLQNPTALGHTHHMAGAPYALMLLCGQEAGFTL